MSEDNIDIVVKVKDSASGPTKEVTRSLKDLDEQAESAASRGLTTLTKGLGIGIVGAAGLAVGALVTVGAAMFDVSFDTQKATGDIAASLGVPIDVAKEFGEVAKQVYGNSFADSVGEAGTVVAGFAQQLNLAADDPALQRMTENAFRLSDAYDVDVTESIDAVKTLVENFGITGDEAFDLIASGFQKGLNRSGDFLDTISEYSTQFANGGADAQEFFSLLDSGLQGGVLGTDKAADAFKEFNVRILDGSTLTADSLEALGINSTEFLGQLSTGQLDVADAFGIVIDKLGLVGDASVQYQTGVGLLGTQFEDLGVSAVLGMSLATDAFADIGNAVESIDVKYTSLDQVGTALWRKFIVNLSPVTDALLSVANVVMPHVISMFDGLTAGLAPVVTWLVEIIETGNLFGETFHLLPVPIQSVINAVSGIVTAVTGFVTSIQTIFQPIADLISKYVSWKDVIIGAGIAITANLMPAIGLAIAAVGSFIAPLAAAMVPILALTAGVAALRLAWENDFGGIQTKTQVVIDYISGVFGPLLTTIKEFGSDALGEIVAWATGNETEFAAVKKIWDATKTSFGTAFTDMGKTLKVWGDKAWSELSERFPKTAAALEGAFVTAKTNVVKAMDYLGEQFTPLGNDIQQFGQGALKEIAAWATGNETDFANTTRIWETAKETFGTVFTDMGEKLTEWGTIAWTEFKENFPEAAGALETAWDSISANFQELWDAIKPLIDTLTETFNTLVADWNSGTTDMSSALGIAKGVLDGIWTIMITVVTTSINTIINTLTLVSQLLSGDWTGAWETANEIVGDLVEGLSTIVGTALDTIAGAFGINVEDITDWYNDTTGKLGDWWDSFKTYIVDKDWFKYGADIVQGLWNGMTSIWNNFFTWASGAWRGVSSSFAGHFEIGSPSKLFTRYGGYLMEGLKNGIANASTGVLSDLEIIAGQISGKISGAVNSVKNAAKGTSNSTNYVPDTKEITTIGQALGTDMITAQGQSTSIELLGGIKLQSADLNAAKESIKAVTDQAAKTTQDFIGGFVDFLKGTLEGAGSVFSYFKGKEETAYREGNLQEYIGSETAQTKTELKGLYQGIQNSIADLLGISSSDLNVTGGDSLRLIDRVKQILAGTTAESNMEVVGGLLQDLVNFRTLANTATGKGYFDGALPTDARLTGGNTMNNNSYTIQLMGTSNPSADLMSTVQLLNQLQVTAP